MLLLYYYYYIGIYIIIMDLPVGSGGGGGGGCAGGGGNPTTCFAIFSLHGMIPLFLKGDGKYYVDAADFPEGVVDVVSPNNMGYSELVDDTGGSTYISTFLRWVRKRDCHTPDTLSDELNAFEKEHMERLDRQMKYERSFDRVVRLGNTPLELTRKLTSNIHGSLYASHTVVNIVKTIKDEAEITWRKHNTGVSPGKLFMPDGTYNQCLFYFPNADDRIIDEISNKLIAWKKNMRSSGDPKWKFDNAKSIELCNRLSLTFENSVLTIQFELGGKENDKWFMVSFNDLFEQLKRVISFSLGSDFVLRHMSNCCIADLACSVFAVPRVPGAPKQEITILGPKTDSPASASAGGSKTLIIDVRDVGFRHPRSFWVAFDQLTRTHKQQQAAAPRPAGSTLHDLVIPHSLSSFLPHLSTREIIHGITPILDDTGNVIGMTVIRKRQDGSFTEEVVMYEPNQPIRPVDGGPGWRFGERGELVVVPSLLDDDDDDDFSHCAKQEDSVPRLSQLSPVPSPEHRPVPDTPPYGGGRRCSKKKKNKNRSMKNRNRAMKKMKTIRNKRKRKNMSVRRRG